MYWKFGSIRANIYSPFYERNPNTIEGEQQLIKYIVKSGELKHNTNPIVQITFM